MTTTTPTEPVEPTATTAPPADQAPRRVVFAAPGPVTSRFVGWLAALTLLGFLVRVLNVFWWRPTTDAPGYHGYRLWGDAFYYHWQANALAKGAWFVDPVLWFLDGSQRPSAGHPPLYPTYLALWSSIGLDGVTAHRLASGVLGTATIVVVALLARRLAGNAAGLIAAAIVALYPQMWINDGMILSETMAIFMTAVALTAAYVFWRTPSMRNACLLGLACGAAALSRTELALMIPLVIVPLCCFLRELDWGRRIKLIVVAGLMSAVIVGPWIVFNYTRFEETTTMTSGTGSALVGRQLRRGLVREAHRLLRQLLPGPVARCEPRRVAARPRAARAGDRVHEGPHLATAARGRRARRAPLGRVQAGTDHDARLVDRGPRARAVVDRPLRLLRDVAVRDLRTGGDAAPEGADHPAARDRGDRHVRGCDHLRRHALPRPGGGATRAGGVDRRGRGVDEVARAPCADAGSGADRRVPSRR